MEKGAAAELDRDIRETLRIMEKEWAPGKGWSGKGKRS